MATVTVLRVDPVACDAFGHCAELVPELIGLDEWGYPVVDGGPVPLGLVDLALRAVHACPRRALALDRIPGTTADPVTPRRNRQSGR
jgi:ferredoxin